MKTIILLDIDGVLLSMGEIPKEALKVGDFVVRASLKNWLQEMSEQVEIVWCSSWQEKSDVFAELLGFETRGWLDFSGKREKNYLWNKLEIIEEFCAKRENCRFVLIDDNANSWLIVPSLVLQKAKDEGRLLVVRPFAYTGISDSEMMEISRWIG
ncbi:HAD domain-containing protein [Lactococcus nasutitermitis]|uniref:HAD domain-containing protein n=1 Tax=Lactococcus nasutitermitis TaxID=1652957 RepID=A0ABV9JG08_9LACT|nr:HAD domain-containing protein [Lactococcus nasutitermitis]